MGIDPSQYVIITAGVAGVGKTLVRCAYFLADVWLPDYEGDHWSNFPVNVDKVVELTVKKHPFLRGKNEELKNRIKVIPKEITDVWMRGESGPWEFFGIFPGNEMPGAQYGESGSSRYMLWAGSLYPEKVVPAVDDKGDEIVRDGIAYYAINLSGAHIALDEAHNFCGGLSHQGGSRQSSMVIREKYRSFIGEIRHFGARIEFLTQDIKKLSSVVTSDAGLWIQLTSGEDRKDPLLGITVRDWVELWAGLTGFYRPVVFETERIKIDGKMQVINERRWRIKKEYFELYNSYSAPATGGAGCEKVAQLREYQRRSRLGILLWFIARNFHRLYWSFIVVCLAVWLLFFGGLIWIWNGFNTKMTAMVKMSTGLDKGKRDNVANAATVVLKEKVNYDEWLRDRDTEKLQTKKGESEVESLGIPSGLSGMPIKSASVEKISQPEIIEEWKGPEYPGIVLIGFGYVVTAEGNRLKKGDSLGYGELESIRIEEIYEVTRKVLLSDGSVLGIGSRVLFKSPLYTKRSVLVERIQGNPSE